MRGPPSAIRRLNRRGAACERCDPAPQRRPGRVRVHRPGARRAQGLDDPLLVFAAASRAWNGSAIVRALASSLTGQCPSAKP